MASAFILGFTTRSLLIPPVVNSSVDNTVSEDVAIDVESAQEDEKFTADEQIVPIESSETESSEEQEELEEESSWSYDDRFPDLPDPDPVECEEIVTTEFVTNYCEERYTDGFTYGLGDGRALNWHGMAIRGITAGITEDGVPTDDYIAFVLILRNLGDSSARYRNLGEFTLENSDGEIVGPVRDKNLAVSCCDVPDGWSEVSLVPGAHEDDAVIYFPFDSSGTFDWQPEGLTPDSIRFEYSAVE